MNEPFVYDLEVGGKRLEVRENLFSDLPPPPSDFQNEKGFLLLEHLISVMIVGILSIAFLSLMQVVQVYTANQTSLTMHEVNTLAIRLQNEIRLAESLSAAEGQLIAYFADGRVVSFSAQNDRLVRQVDGLGGEIMVYNLAGMDVTISDNQSARVSLRSLDGEVFQFYLRVLHLEVRGQIGFQTI